ncbi:hypothetical protein LCGC14_2543990, partial [marine sediment metagenome]
MGTFTPLDSRPCRPLPRCYLRNPCIVVWIPTPQCLPSALTRFFLGSFGLTLSYRGSAHRMIVTMQLLRRANFEAVIISLCSNPYTCSPPWLHLPLELIVSRAAGTFTPRNEHVVTQHELWYRYTPESSNWRGGTFSPAGLRHYRPLQYDFSPLFFGLYP